MPLVHNISSDNNKERKQLPIQPAQHSQVIPELKDSQDKIISNEIMKIMTKVCKIQMYLYQTGKWEPKQKPNQEPKQDPKQTKTLK